VSERCRHRTNINEPGHAHELTFGCYRRFPFLKAERVRDGLAEAIQNAKASVQFQLWAYVFMPDHVHLIVWPTEADYDIARIRKAIKAPVACQAIAWMEQQAPRWLTRITRNRGGQTERLFWQSGGGCDRNITSSEALERMMDYVHANPVRKGLVARPSDWKWSSAGWCERRSPGPLAVDPIPREWAT
jgi:putative transposase